jgi:hypothetical protein
MAQLLSKHTLFWVHETPNGTIRVEKVFSSPFKDETAKEFLKSAHQQTETTWIVWRDKLSHLRGYKPETNGDEILPKSSKLRRTVELYLSQTEVAL